MLNELHRSPELAMESLDALREHHNPVPVSKQHSELGIAHVMSTPHL